MKKETVMKICFYIFLFRFCCTAGIDQYTGYTGGSVLLSCSFMTPPVQRFSWLYLRGSGRDEIFRNKKYEGRLKLFNESSPANLSLLISDLRKEDEGNYRCEFSPVQFIDISIIIKGCDLVQNKQTVEVMQRPGESVVLPCYCYELHAKPKEITWTFHLKNKTLQEIYPSDQSQKESELTGIKLLNENFPGNLSLLISDLITEHQGLYRCSVQSQHTDIILTVEVNDLLTEEKHTNTTNLFILLSISGISILLLTVLTVIVWRCREVRNRTDVGPVLRNNEEKQGALTQEQHVKQEENKDEVTYCAVIHLKKAAIPAHRHIVTAEHSEYASLK